MRWFWVDRFVEFKSRNYAKAVKNITLAEEHLHDHFPGSPLMPNSLVIEGLAQTGGLLVSEYNEFTEKIVLAKIPKAEFHCPAQPGDTLTYTTTLEYVKEDGAMVSATSYNGGRLQAEMEIVYAHLKNGMGAGVQFDPRLLLASMRTLGAFEVGEAADGTPLREPDLAPPETVPASERLRKIPR